MRDVRVMLRSLGWAVHNVAPALGGSDVRTVSMSELGHESQVTARLVGQVKAIECSCPTSCLSDANDLVTISFGCCGIIELTVASRDETGRRGKSSLTPLYPLPELARKWERGHVGY